MVYKHKPSKKKETVSGETACDLSSARKGAERMHKTFFEGEIFSKMYLFYHQTNQSSEKMQRYKD